jgi:hypothetical protein
MDSGIMLRTWLKPALLVAVLGSCIAGIPAGATDSAGTGEHSAAVQLAQFGCRMFGPYATMRRANEVANEARGYGYSAVAFHNGDGYYVRVC